MINKLRVFINRKKIIRDSFLKYSIYLSNGRYVFDKNLTFIYLKDNNNKSRYHHLFEKKIHKRKLYSIIIYLLRYTIFNKTISVNNKIRHDFNGTVFLPANTNDIEKDVKVFNFKNRRVLTIHTNMDKFNKKIDTYNFFSPFYPIPKMVEFDKEELMVIEELVDYKPKHKWTTKETMDIIDNINGLNVEYFRICNESNHISWRTPSNIVDCLIDEDYIGDFLHNNMHLLIPLEKQEFPFIDLHGDFWSYNVLLSQDNKYFIIDWEHSKEYILFYDFFWFLQYEANYNQDFTYMDKYFLGDYDDYFQESFNIFGLQFEKKYRLNYFYIFILEVFAVRFFHISQEDKILWLKSLENLLEVIKSKVL